ncbi:hypothetical protein [Caballeronia sp. LZ035]|nr:hypothetical protein [Caballeronia sp. LZ035]MDR5759824.1 hypothetical protein [Caballeronia sp. LZ035]
MLLVLELSVLAGVLAAGALAALVLEAGELAEEEPDAPRRR